PWLSSNSWPPWQNNVPHAWERCRVCRPTHASTWSCGHCPVRWPPPWPRTSARPSRRPSAGPNANSDGPSGTRTPIFERFLRGFRGGAGRSHADHGGSPHHAEGADGEGRHTPHLGRYRVKSEVVRGDRK